MGCGASAESGANPKRKKSFAGKELSAEGEEAEIPRGAGADCQIALRWNFIEGQPADDLDVCAVALNGDGVLHDAAFYNNKRALGGAVVHYGDCKDGAKEGDDEVMELDLDAVPMRGVCTIAICVFAYKGSSLTDVDSIVAFVRTRGFGDSWPNVARIPISGIQRAPGVDGPVTGIVAAGLWSPDKGKSWKVKRMFSPIQGPRNHQDARDKIRDVCFTSGIVASPPAGGPVMSEDRVFNMRKGDRVGVGHDCIVVGLGWEIKAGMPKIDLDASCMLLGPAPQSGYAMVTDVVWHNDTQAPGIQHSGDNRTGDAEGDDEQITIKLSSVVPEALRLVITINSYNGYFSSVHRAWARVCTTAGKEMARYNLEAQKSQAVILCAFDRQSKFHNWSFSAIGEGCAGKTAKSGECMDAVRGKPPRAIPDLTPGQSIFLPPTLYDDYDDTVSILDEWGCRGAWIWLDATVLIFRKDGTRIGGVDFKNNHWPAGERRPVIFHSGDRTDETQTHGSHEIRIKMLRLTQEYPDVFSLLLVISAYSKDLSYAVKPFVSLRDNDSSEIARFEPDTNFNATSIQMVDIHRHQRGWMLSAHGILGDGKANEYAPIERVYRQVLREMFKSGGDGPPEIDYSKVRQQCGVPAYRRGPPVT